jgi:hypothetical protein
MAHRRRAGAKANRRRPQDSIDHHIEAWRERNASTLTIRGVPASRDYPAEEPRIGALNAARVQAGLRPVRHLGDGWIGR